MQQAIVVDVWVGNDDCAQIVATDYRHQAAIGGIAVECDQSRGQSDPRLLPIRCTSRQFAWFPDGCGPFTTFCLLSTLLLFDDQATVHVACNRKRYSQIEERTLDALLRHWAMLRMIPRHPRRIDTGRIRDGLERLGYSITLRSIQRDLNKLAVLPLSCDESNRRGGGGGRPKPGYWKSLAWTHRPRWSSRWQSST